MKEVQRWQAVFTRVPETGSTKVLTELATELGLCWPEDAKPHVTIGYSAVVLAEGTNADDDPAHYDLEACTKLMRGGSKSFFAASRVVGDLPSQPMPSDQIGRAHV